MLRFSDYIYDEAHKLIDLAKKEMNKNDTTGSTDPYSDFVYLTH